MSKNNINNSVITPYATICSGTPTMLNTSGNINFNCISSRYSLFLDTSYNPQYFIRFYGPVSGVSPIFSIQFESQDSDLVQSASSWYYISTDINPYIMKNQYSGYVAGDISFLDNQNGKGEGNQPAIYDVYYTDTGSGIPSVYYRIIVNNRNITAYASVDPFTDWPSNYNVSSYGEKIFNQQSINKKFNKSDSHYDKYKKIKYH